MKRAFVIGITVMALGAGAMLQAQSPRSADVQMKAAQQKAEVEGDLKGAIEEYEKIVAAAGSNRALAAQALVRMAACYQKLGDTESRRIYERLIREYADQPEAVAIARARLGGAVSTRASIRRGDRAVWTGRDVDQFGTISPDGRFLTYVDWGGNQNLMVRDLVAGTNRALTLNTKLGEFGQAQYSVFSRDGSQVAYQWSRPDRVYEIRITSPRGSGVTPFRAVREFRGVRDLRLFDWSPDARSIALLLAGADGATRIAIMSLADGELRVLKSIDWRGVNKMVFSPDGRFIAYDMTIADPPNRSGIYMMAVDASRESAVVEDGFNNHVMGWAPDGRLVFASDRSGILSLWTTAIENGRPSGAPRIAKEHIGSTWSLGLTPAGTLYVFQQASASSVTIAAIDAASGKLLNSSTALFQRFIESRGRPSWSPNGKYLSYISCGTAGGGRCALFIRSSETGSVREIPHRLRYLQFPRVAPDGRAIVTDGTDLRGRPGIFLIDAMTGETTLFASADRLPGAGRPEWRADGQAIRYNERRDGDRVLFEHGVAAGEARELFRTTAANTSFIRVSPDGRLVAFVRGDPAEKRSIFMIAPLSGGAPHAVFNAPGTYGLDGQHWQWTADSQAVVVQKDGNNGPTELWRISVTGAAQKLDLDLSQWAEGFSIHPNGHEIAFAAQAGAPGAEVWALENFLPPSSVSEVRK